MAENTVEAIAGMVNRMLVKHLKDLIKIIENKEDK